MKPAERQRTMVDRKNAFVVGVHILILWLLLPVSMARAYADLVVTDIQAPATMDVGEYVTVSWTDTNQGDWSALWFYFPDQVVLSKGGQPGDDDIPLYPLDTPIAWTGLGPGESRVRQASFLVRSYCEPGDYFLMVVGDYRNEVSESDELNNSCRVPVRVRQSDLVVTGIDAPSHVGVGECFNVSWTVENIGDGRAPSSGGSWNDKVYLSRDDQLSSDDVCLATTWAGPISAGESYTTTYYNVCVNAPGGYYLLAKADAGDRYTVEERNEENNVLSRRIRVGSPEADVTVAKAVLVQEPDNMLVPYDRFTLELVIENRSTELSEEVHVSLRSRNESISFCEGGDQHEIDLPPLAGLERTSRPVCMQVAGIVDEPDNQNAIMTEIIAGRRTISLLEAIAGTMTMGGSPDTRGFVVSPVDDKGNVLYIGYPSFKKTMAELPNDDEDGFYLRGDPGFHHPDDKLIRKYAIMAASGNGNVFPDDVGNAMENVFNFIDERVENNADMYLRSDVEMVERLPAGVQYQPCIGQAYLFGSFARTLGVPARELTVALGNSLSYEGPRYGQEGAVQVWYDDEWHLYDTFERVKNFGEYLQTGEFYKYRAWYSYSRRTDWHDLGHNFEIIEAWGRPPFFTGWRECKEDACPSTILVTHSPVYAYVMDPLGRTTGCREGGIREEIPSSSYRPAGSRISTNRADPTAYWKADETIIMASDEPKTYTLVLTGTADGHYDLTIARISDEGTIDSSTIGFDIRKDETHTYGVTIGPTGAAVVTRLPARLDVDPDTVNLRSQGKWVTCYIELPAGFDVKLIDGGTVQLNGVPAYLGKEGWASRGPTNGNIADHDGDGILARMVKFDATAVHGTLSVGNATITVKGSMTDGTTFEGTSTVTVTGRPAK